MLTELQDRPAIAVFEDVHWADEATLDLLRYLGRRIARTTALLVLTYRDDEIGPTHPLRTVLGDLASSSASLHLPLSPLSELAVRVLVGRRSIDVAALHRQTAGNPFYVTEVLSGTGDGLPLTVRDAVLGRVARLSASAQTVAEAAAVLGPRIEPWLLADMVPSDAHAADECLVGGVLVAQGDGLAFRHELARQAVLESIPSVRLASAASSRPRRVALDARRATRPVRGLAAPGAPCRGRRRPPGDLDLRTGRRARSFSRRRPSRGRRPVWTRLAAAPRRWSPPTAPLFSRRTRGSAFTLPTWRPSSPADGRQSSCGARRATRSSKVNAWPCWRARVLSTADATRRVRRCRARSTCSRRSRPAASWRWPTTRGRCIPTWPTTISPMPSP